MGGNQVKYLTTYLLSVMSTVEVFDISAGFKEIVFVCVKRLQHEKRSAQTDTSQHEIARTILTEIKIARLVEEDVRVVSHALQTQTLLEYRL